MPYTPSSRKEQSHAYYLAHKDEIVSRTKAWRLKNPDAFKLQRACYRKKNRTQIAERSKRDRARPEEKARVRVSGKQKRWALFLRVLAAYGNQCSCCGERAPLFLTIDHKNNDGAAHRAQLKPGTSIYRWLEKNGYPQDRFQILCWNCNMGRSRNGGICPHMDQK